MVILTSAAPLKPKLLQMTSASFVLKSSSHTVPHTPNRRTSTRPSMPALRSRPPTKRISKGDYIQKILKFSNQNNMRVVL